MKQHVLAFAAALAVWVVGNLVVAVVAQQCSSGIRVNLAASSLAPNAKTIITDDARCVEGSCTAWYLFSCNGHLPDCNGGCWVTGYYPCSACLQESGAICVQEQVTVNANLYRYPCTSDNGYDCNSCDWTHPYRFGPYYVTTWRCR